MILDAQRTLCVLFVYIYFISVSNTGKVIIIEYIILLQESEFNQNKKNRCIKGLHYVLGGRKLTLF